MRTSLIAVLALAALPTATLAMDQHGAVLPKNVKWGPAPPALPPGAQIAVIAGDPSKEGAPFVIRAKLSAGHTVPPHTHPTDENITVLSGSFHFAMGDKLDKKRGQTIPAGGFVRAEKDMHHYAWVSAPTIIQVHGIGPFAITYLNPADDPRNKAAKK